MKNYEKVISIQLLISTLVAIMIIIFIISSIYRVFDKSNIHTQTKIVTVTDKRVKKSGNTDKYLIYTKDKKNNKINVFEISDSIISGRFNSSDIFASIEIGKTYKFTYAGHRNYLFSWYPNIYQAEEQ